MPPRLAYGEVHDRWQAGARQRRGGFDAALAGIRCAAYDRTIDGHRRFRHNPEQPAPLPRRPHSMLEMQPTTVVSLSDAAASKLRELTAEETNPAIGLRVYVYSGGCSGFRYGMMLEDAPTAEDKILEANGVKVYVDGKSIDLLKGSEIDYVDTLMGAGFTVNNPNAVAACGCGSSFRTADDTGSPKGCSH
jgi:iron-sulfur cluster assembly protein